MNLPSTPLTFAGGSLTLPVQQQRVETWQAHLAKHPLGVRAMALTKNLAAWDREGWTTLGPPAFSEAARDDLITRIGALELGAAGGCTVPEFGSRAGRVWSDPARLACWQCAPVVRHACTKVEHGVATLAGAYRRITEEVLTVVSDPHGLLLPRSSVAEYLFRNLQKPDASVGLTIMSFGSNDSPSFRGPIVRAQRWDGVRVDLYRKGAQLSWRTTYRLEGLDARGPSSHVRSFQALLAMPPADLHPLSDKCVVPRLWWESHVC